VIGAGLAVHLWIEKPILRVMRQPALFRYTLPMLVCSFVLVAGLALVTVSAALN